MGTKATEPDALLSCLPPCRPPDRMGCLPQRWQSCSRSCGTPRRRLVCTVRCCLPQRRSAGTVGLTLCVRDRQLGGLCPLTALRCVTVIVYKNPWVPVIYKVLRKRANCSFQTKKFFRYIRDRKRFIFYKNEKKFRRKFKTRTSRSNNGRVLYHITRVDCE